MHTASEYRAAIRAIIPTVHPGASLDAAIYHAIESLIADDVDESRSDGEVTRPSTRMTGV